VIGGLEPRRDGIGDYTRRLAGALARRGVSTAILAHADDFVREPLRARAEAEDGGFEILRLPRHMPFPERTALGRTFLDEVGATHVNFGFAAYALDLKGVASRAPVELPEMTSGRPVSVLFHETWIGEEAGASYWNRLVGFSQRRVIQLLMHDLAPVRMWSTNPLYHAMLAAYGMPTAIVPHFGNVPVQDTDASGWLPQGLRDRGFDPGPQGLNGLYLVGLFGSLYRDLDLPGLLPTLREVAHRKGRRLCIVNIGIGADRPDWHAWKARFGPEHGLIDFGASDTLTISQYINSLDLGITTTSLAQFGKSGTAAAFIEHGLPILVPIETPRFRSWRDEMAAAMPVNCLRTTPDLVERILAAPRLPRASRLEPLADLMVRELNLPVDRSAAR